MTEKRPQATKERTLFDVLIELIVAQGELLTAEKLEACDPRIYAARAEELRERVAELVRERDALWDDSTAHTKKKCN